MANECLSACGLIPNRVLQEDDVASDETLHAASREAGTTEVEEEWLAGPRPQALGSGLRALRSGSRLLAPSGFERNAPRPRATYAAFFRRRVERNLSLLGAFAHDTNQPPSRVDIESSRSRPTSSLRRKPEA